MSLYIADTYAPLLSEEDVSILFNLLAKKLNNNRSRAARTCGLTGKATYDWERTSYVKLGTKKKVLEASLRENFLCTMQYLLNMSNERNQDLLQNILSSLYADAQEATTPDCFKQALAQFDTIRQHNLGKIRDGLQAEVTDMTQSLQNKAAELGVSVPQKSIEEFSAAEILRIFAIIGQTYSKDPAEAEVLAQKTIQLPSNVAKPILHTFKLLCSPTETHMTTADTDLMGLKQPAGGALILDTAKTLEYRKNSTGPEIWEFAGISVDENRSICNIHGGINNTITTNA